MCQKIGEYSIVTYLQTAAPDPDCSGEWEPSHMFTCETTYPTVEAAQQAADYLLDLNPALVFEVFPPQASIAVCDNCGKDKHTPEELQACIESMLGPPRWVND